MDANTQATVAAPRGPGKTANNGVRMFNPAAGQAPSAPLSMGPMQPMSGMAFNPQVFTQPAQPYRPPQAAVAGGGLGDIPGFVYDPATGSYKRDFGNNPAMAAFARFPGYGRAMNQEYSPAEAMRYYVENGEPKTGMRMRLGRLDGR